MLPSIANSAGHACNDSIEKQFSFAKQTKTKTIDEDMLVAE